MRRQILALSFGWLLLLTRAALCEVPTGVLPPEELLIGPAIEVPAENLYYDMDAEFDWRTPTYWLNFGGGNGYTEVASPFWQPIEGLENLDYEPDDGWVLMARSFGSPSEIVQSPFLILYNKYRGTVRFIIYLHQALHENYPYGRVVMRFANGSPKTKSLTNRSIQLPLSREGYDEPVVMIPLQSGWNYADFSVRYDPNTASVTDAFFAFDVDGIDENTLQLDGVSVTETTVPVTDSDPTLSDYLATLVPGLNQYQKYYKSTGKILEDAGTYAQKHSWTLNSAAWLAITTPLFAHHEIVQVIAGLVGFGEKFIGLNKKNQEPSTTRTESQIALRGTIRAQDNIEQVLLRVPGANHTANNALPVWDYPLGVFAILNTPPTSYVTSNSAYRQNALNNPCVPCGPYFSWFDYMDVLHLDAPIQYAINTSYPGAMQLRSLEAAWTFQAPHPVSAGSPGRWNQTPPYYIDWMMSLLNSGRFVVSGSADPLGLKYYQYRTQYVDISQFHLFKPEVPRVFLTGEPFYTRLSGITPPVQFRARFMKPGGAPRDDAFIVENYDVWFPDTSPFGQPPGWTPPAMTPVWKEAEAPLQPITSPVAGSLVPRGQPWEIRWTPQVGSITNVELRLSSDNGATYPTVLTSGISNPGQFTAPAPAIGSQYWLRLRTTNAPAVADFHAGPFTVWGVNQASVTGTLSSFSSCEPGYPSARLVVSWTTSVATNGEDRVQVQTAGGATYTGTATPASPATSHSIAFTFPWGTGDITYSVSSTLNGAVATSDPVTFTIGTAPMEWTRDWIRTPGTFPSTVVEPGQTVNMAFYQKIGTAPGALVLGWRESGCSWRFQDVERDATLNVGLRSALAIGPQRVIGVVYLNQLGTSSYEFRYNRGNRPSSYIQWARYPKGVLLGTSPIISRPAIAFDAAGTAHVVYADNTGLKYFSINSAMAVTGPVTISTLPKAGQHSSSIAIDGLGNPCVAFSIDNGTPPYALPALGFARRTGGFWSAQPTQTISTTAGFGARLALDAAGQPRIACMGDGGNLVYAKYSNATSSWSFATVTTSGIEDRVALMLDGSGLAHMAIWARSGSLSIPTYVRERTTTPQWETSPFGSSVINGTHSPVDIGLENGLPIIGYTGTEAGTSGIQVALGNTGTLDTTPPAAVTNLSVVLGRTTAVVSWPATGDDGTCGTASYYDVRHSGQPINGESGFAAATPLTVLGCPSPPGMTDCADMSGINPCSPHYFALKVRDNAGNWSAISNVAYAANCNMPRRFFEVLCEGGGAFASRPAPQEGEAEATPAVLAFSIASANPVRGNTSFRLDVPSDDAGSVVRIGIYDAQGRRVKTVLDEVARPGRHTLPWDLRAENGSKARPGVYFARMQVGSKSILRSLVVVE